MPQKLILIALAYALVAAFAIIITIYDKRAARKRKRRIPENFLMLVAIGGGALPMLITMKTINHKTQHNKFMLGLPAVILIHVLGIIGVMFLKYT